MLALDLRATEFYKDGALSTPASASALSEEQAKYLADLTTRYPISRSKTAWPKMISKAGKSHQGAG